MSVRVWKKVIEKGSVCFSVRACVRACVCMCVIICELA